MPYTLSEEIEFLRVNTHFTQRPATLTEFIGPKYLNIEGLVRPAVRDCLVEIIGDEVDPHRLTRWSKAMITGGIGIGKTTIASIVLPYLAHWVMCLRDPQGYFDLLPGSRIAFMQMSTSGPQAKEVVFGDVKARVQNAPWFKSRPFDKNFKNQLRFPGDIWILPGDSAETTFEGYNILGGILDEADSHKVTDTKDYADQGYDTITNRIASRFEDRGFILVIGQMKKSSGFAARKYKELQADPEAYTQRMTIWESFGWSRYTKDDGTRDSFWYDVKRKTVVPWEFVEAAQGESGEHFIEVPTMFRDRFLNDPAKALRDLAGIPPAVGDPFIAMTHKIEEARDRWTHRWGIDTPYSIDGRWHSGFRAKESIPRVAHIDIAYSAKGDALGFAMGHVRGMVEYEDELKPYIVIDCLVRMKALSGTEIRLSDVRKMIYHLRDNLGFKLQLVTTDGFESTDTRQQLRRKRIRTDVTSVDRDLTPYYDLRDALTENRIEFPRYLVNYNRGDTTPTEVLLKELSELEDMGKKIDHPPDGSKDVADAVAAVCFNLMGDKRYHKSGTLPASFLPKMPAPQTTEIRQRPTGSVIDALPTKAPLPPPSRPVSWRPPTRRG